MTESSEPSLIGRVLRVAGLLGIFLGGLLGTGELVRRRLPFPPVPFVQPKVMWLAEHGEEYDTLMVGSSRTVRQIVPALFDELMAAGGQPTRSFNLGLDGIRPPEDSYLLETVLASRRKPLKYVLVEGNHLRLSAVETQDTMRGWYWYDLKRCGVVVRGTLWHTSSDETTWFGIWGDRVGGIGNFLSHVQPALSRAINLGRGYERWWPHRLQDQAEGQIGEERERERRGGGEGGNDEDEPEVLSQENLGQNHDGWVYGRDKERISKRNLKKLEEGLEERLREPAKPYFSDAESQRVLQEKQRVIEAHGGRMIVFLPPMTDPEIFYPDPKFGPVPPMIDLTDPKAYPELYDPKFRKDHSHLNPAGAEIFTRLLVEKILAKKGEGGRMENGR